MHVVYALFVSLFCGCCRGQDKFYFSKSPKDTTVISGKSVTLECQVSSEDGIIYYWKRNGESLVNTTRRYQQESNLHITRADPVQDGGEFACIAQNVTTGFSVTSLAASLDILWLGDKVVVQQQSPDTTEVKAGADLILRCNVEGTDDIKYEWFRNTEHVTKSEHVSLHKRRLHIKGVSPADNGIYWCAARNDAGYRISENDFALTVKGKSSPVLKVRPGSTLARVGDSVRFECFYDQVEVTEWYFNVSTFLENSTRITVFPNGTLVIRNIEESDEGFYSCIGINGEATDGTQKYSVKLKIAYIEDLTGDSFEPPLVGKSMHIVPEKAEFETTCMAPSANPPARMSWLDPRGHTISDSGRVRVDDMRLIVEHARADEDAGNYTCVAENMAGTKKASLNLIVTTPPSIIHGPLTVSVEEGRFIMLHCQYEALPPPITSVHWLKNNKPVFREPHHTMIHPNGTLVLWDVQLEDKGEYVCVVNTSGFTPVKSKPALVHVKEKLKFSPQPVNKRLEYDSVSKVYCKATGATPLVIKWIKLVKALDGEEQPMLSFPEHIQDLNGTLVFNKVTFEDKGRYMCVATNSQGLINATIEIDVVVKPKFSIMPRDPTEAYEGYPVMIHCLVDGNPKPTINWDRNTNVSGLDEKRFHVLENGSLWVQEVHMSDSGRYACTAGNSGGLAREEVTLIVRSAEGYRPGDELEGESSMMTKTFTITLSAATAYMLLVIGLMIWCRYRRRKRKQAYLNANGAEVMKAENGDVVGEHTELKETVTGQREGKDKDCPRSDSGDTAHSHGSGNSKRSKNSYDRVSFPRNDLHSMVLLGRGQFGDVFLAKANGIQENDPKDKETVVMVKSLQQTRDENALLEFKRELDMFHKLNHDYVAKLLGLCREADPHYMILEYSDWGDLKQFLLATRATKDNSRSKNPRPPQLSVTQIIQLSNQIALGMEHLSNQRFVHRDLAARNCLISSNLTVKVSLAGLCKDTYSKEYCKFRNQIIPLRWMPFEAVYEDDSSTKSDVYSFACLVWEMFHQGELPHSKMSDEAVLTALKRHELQLKPHKAAPQSLQTLLISCWSQSPRDRPTFTQLVQTIGEISVDSEM